MALHEKMCQKVFDEMMAHLRETSEMLDVERMMGGDGVQLLPVLCLSTGINLPDHETTFFLLSERIRQDVTHKLCRLHSIQCTNIKNTFGVICEQLGVTFSGEGTQKLQLFSNLKSFY